MLQLVLIFFSGMYVINRILEWCYLHSDVYKAYLTLLLSTAPSREAKHLQSPAGLVNTENTFE